MVGEMTREQWKERLPIIQAYVDGKTVEYKHRFGEWITTGKEGFSFDGEGEYRIKPEPKLRPWKPEEVPVGGVIRRKSDGSRMLIINVFQSGVHVGDSTTPVGFDSLLKNFERFAGFGECQPCGVQEEA
jgi:hypothetical protein